MCFIIYVNIKIQNNIFCQKNMYIFVTIFKRCHLLFEFIFLFLITSFLILCSFFFFFHKFAKNKNIEQSLRIDVESLKLDTKYFISSIIFVVFILSISLFFPLALIFNQLGLEYLLCIVFFIFVIFYILVYTFLKRIII